MKNQQNWLQLILWGFITITSTPANAQITPDNTLNSESSRFTPNVQINGASADRIDGGATRGSNLFHSFSQFNINDRQRVYFGNPTGIENILTRVTGTEASNIFGTLGVDGAANLFLINPNGILFGKNAQLDIRASFVGTTANQIQFGNQGIFSATNPQAPPLLTVNPSALLFTQLSGSGITNQSQAPAGINPAGENVTGLRVADGKSLLLAGGDINIDGGSLRAYGGRIDLAGLAAPGSIGINVAGDTLSLSVPNDVARADISLTNAGEVNVRGADAGNIAINARNLSLAGESKVRAGIDTGLGTPQSQGGNIDINATGTTTLTDTSFIANVTVPGAVGKGGDINITTGSLEILSGSSLNSSIFGQGDGGNINLDVADVLTIGGIDQKGLSSAILSNVVSAAEGNGGNININARIISLSESDGGIFAITAGKGNAGNIFISADLLSMVNGGIYSTVEKGAIGNGGNININAETVSATNGAELQASTSGQGNGGNIIVNAKDRVSFDGKGKEINSRAIAAVQSGAVGNGGDIQVTTGTLSLSNEAFFSTSTGGIGDAGNITIDARNAVELDGSYADSNVFSGGVGNGGDIKVTTGTLSLINGGQLSTVVAGEGEAGNITVDARDAINLDGIVGFSRSAILSSLLTGAVGKGGDIRLTTGSLSVTNGAGLDTTTNGQGNAGNIFINARDTVTFDGVERGRDQVLPLPSNANSSVASNAVGNGGEIQVNASALFLANGGNINANTFGQGDAGKITINTRDLVSLDGNNSRVTTVGGRGNGGDIQVTTGTVSLTNGGEISAFARGNAGNITIDARDAVNLDGVGSNGGSSLVSTLLFDGTGKSGNIQITTGSLAVTNGAQLVSSTAGNGNGGNININARDTVKFDGVGSNNISSGAYTTVESTGVGDAGNIKLTTGSLSLSSGGLINASTFGQGNAGDIDINARDAITANGTGSDGFSSGVFSVVGQTAVGNGGDILINGKNTAIKDGGQISVSSAGKGDAGDISITGGSLTLNNGTISAQTASSQGGNMNLQLADFLLLRRGSQISTTAGIAQAGGDGGNITINTPFIVSLLLENNDITANAFSGKGGNVDINVRSIFGIEARSQPTPQSDITATSELGVQGQISIQQPDVQPTEGLVELPTEVIDASNQIGQNCPRGRNAKKPLGELIVSGRGGSLPPNSLQPLTGINKIRDLATLDGESSKLTASSIPYLPPTQSAIVEAQGWVKTPDGKIILVAQVPTATPNITTASAVCPVYK